jgi:hypothetical protein
MVIPVVIDKEERPLGSDMTPWLIGNAGIRENR